MMTTAYADRLRTIPPSSTPCRDVVVWGNVSCAYVITDALRAAGLSVGSWLMPTVACPARALAELNDDLTRNHIPHHWQTTPVVVTVWQTTPLAHTLAPLLRHIHDRNDTTVHVDLSPTLSPPVASLHVHAPLQLDWAHGRAYHTPTTATALRANYGALAPLTPASRAATATSRVLHALITHTPQAM